MTNARGGLVPPRVVHLAKLLLPSRYGCPSMAWALRVFVMRAGVLSAFVIGTALAACAGRI